MESLWDLCVEPLTAAFVASHRGLAALTGAVERARGDGRIAEICLGTLANICSHRSVTEAIVPADLAELVTTTLRGLSSSDGLAVLQALRLSCALLCGPAAGSCGELLGEAALERYLFSFEQSLRWEVVQHACNALSQGLVLEARTAEGDERPQFAALLSRVQLAPKLAARAAELAGAIAGDDIGENPADGDPEAALLSMLCLAESFVTTSGCHAADLLELGNSALMAVARADRPEVLAAALELLSTLGQALHEENAEQSTTSKASEHRRLCEKVRHFAASTAGLAERLALLLAEPGQASAGCASGAALVLLQNAPTDEVAEHREVLAAVLAAASEADDEEFADSSAALGGLTQRFVDWLREPPAEEMQ